jgi:CBS domain-containing protein
VTVQPDTTVRELLDQLAEHNIGACIVSADGETVSGIVSERDVVRGLVRHGTGLLDQTVLSIATVEVHTADPDTHIDDLMRLMTDQRIRHVPVIVDDRLHGIISIGDVVKRRIDELETERTTLTEYITGSRT